MLMLVTPKIEHTYSMVKFPKLEKKNSSFLHKTGSVDRISNILGNIYISRDLPPRSRTAFPQVPVKAREDFQLP